MWRVIDKHLLQRLWLTRTWEQNDTFNLYIDSPFCAQACSFCMLRSTLRDRNNRDAFQTYHDALLEEIRDWAPVLRSRPIDTVYFGGGTPSLISPELMHLLFDAVPGIQTIPSKCFESDPLSLTPLKLEILASYRFSYVTFGIQTFDREELHRQHRTNPHIGRLKDLTSYALRLGIEVSYDLMCFLNGDDDADRKRLAADLRLAMGELRPSAIDIYPMMPKLEGDDTVTVPRIRSLRQLLSESKKGFPEYRMVDERYLLDGDPATFADRYRNYFLLRKECGSYFGVIKAYSCSDVISAPETQNTLGLGGYGSREVYSYLDRKQVAYYSRFNDNAKAFVYY